MRVELYSSPNCALCEDARAAIQRVHAQIPFELVEVDVSGRPDLRQRFRFEIPVVFIDGEQAFRHRVDEPALLRRLENKQA